MPAGLRRFLIQIQRSIESRSAKGEIVRDWTTVAKPWASKRDLSAREMLSAMASESRVTTEFGIPYRTDITPAMRILHDNTVYDIIAVTSQKGPRADLHLLAARNDG